jgi:hypothetical protein
MNTQSIKICPIDVFLKRQLTFLLIKTHAITANLIESTIRAENTAKKLETENFDKICLTGKLSRIRSIEQINHLKILTTKFFRLNPYKYMFSSCEGRDVLKIPDSSITISY